MSLGSLQPGVGRLAGLVVLAICSSLLASCDGGSGTQATDQPTSTVSSSDDDSLLCAEKPDASKLEGDIAKGAPQHVLFLVDQTTDFPDDVKTWLKQEVQKHSRAGTTIEIGSFSAFSDTSHSKILASATFDNEYPAELRDDAPMHALEDYDACVSNRRETLEAALTTQIDTAFGQYDKDAERSGIVAALKSFSERFEGDDAQSRILILASDMLENSGGLSFYSSKSGVSVAPGSLDGLVAKGRIPQWKGVDVVIVGSGLIPSDVKAFRNEDDLDRLDSFWRGYFDKAGAKQVEIGHPIPMRAP